jgi:hypothetical protein
VSYAIVKIGHLIYRQPRNELIYHDTRKRKKQSDLLYVYPTEGAPQQRVCVHRCQEIEASRAANERAQGLRDTRIIGKSVTGSLKSLSSHESLCQYDSIYLTVLSHKWIIAFLRRVRERFYERKVVKLISTHPVPVFLAGVLQVIY